jgi:erythromycin esterase-like protein
MKRSGPFYLALGVMLAFTAGPALAQLASSRAAVPVDPIVRILDAFQTHPLVALGEGGHGNEQTHRFRLALIRDPRFAATVNDIVVESGLPRVSPSTLDRSGC